MQNSTKCIKNQDADKLTEIDVRQWIHKSGVLFYLFDRPKVYVHRYKKIGCYERFYINFSVKSGKLLVYSADERKLKKKIFFATKSKAEMFSRDLYEIYHNALWEKGDKNGILSR